jgi:predicted metal-dependent peptidase
MSRKKNKQQEENPNTERIRQAFYFVSSHPLFDALMPYGPPSISNTELPPGLWGRIDCHNRIILNGKRNGTSEEWSYVLAHLSLHLGFGHFQQRAEPAYWNMACDIVIDRFLQPLKLGNAPSDFVYQSEIVGNNEDQIYEQLCKLRPEVYGAGDMLLSQLSSEQERKMWQRRLAIGLSQAVSRAVDVVGGELDDLRSYQGNKNAGQIARDWFMTSYPLLGALASNFEIEYDSYTCQRQDIRIAAVDIAKQIIYINPAAGLGQDEIRFVMAHEILHAALRHDLRCQGRDSFLWNLACDYVINAWLIEMQVGIMPDVGALYDPELKGLSAEAIYDMITKDMRRFRKLASLRGNGMSDIIEPGEPEWWNTSQGVALDELYRGLLAQGLNYHQSLGRGYIPADLEEEIRVISQPPIPWDVELARWFAEHFDPIELRRSYARPSRRQSSTPDIPLPRYVADDAKHPHRTFGVVIDTSGSMDSEILGKALGAIASYSQAHQVPHVRVVFCDAMAYDQGYMPTEQIVDNIKVRGRGGTVLQPGIDLLENADDFPDDGPILVITDTDCDVLRIRREHAYLIPDGRSLPFRPYGPVFRLR